MLAHVQLQVMAGYTCSCRLACVYLDCLVEVAIMVVLCTGADNKDTGMLGAACCVH